MLSNNHEEITIESLKKQDLPQLEEVFSRAFGDGIHIGRLRHRVQRIRQFYYILLPLRHLSTWVKNLFSIYVIKITNQTIGFIQVSYLSSVRLHIDYIAISKKYRSRGIGSKVLQTILEKVVDPKNLGVVLEVGNNNPANNLYKRFGFAKQGQILHFARNIDIDGTVLENKIITGFRKIREADRVELSSLYRSGITRKLQNVAGQYFVNFKTNLFIRGMEWFKDLLMQNNKQEYVLEINGDIVATLIIRSNSKYAEHIIQLIIHPLFEKMRQELLEKAISILQEKFPVGRISTTIYDDKVQKQKVLEQLDFNFKEAYNIMYRQPKSKVQREFSLLEEKKVKNKDIVVLEN